MCGSEWPPSVSGIRAAPCWPNRGGGAKNRAEAGARARGNDGIPRNAIERPRQLVSGLANSPKGTERRAVILSQSGGAVVMTVKSILGYRVHLGAVRQTAQRNLSRARKTPGSAKRPSPSEQGHVSCSVLSLRAPGHRPSGHAGANRSPRSVAQRSLPEPCAPPRISVSKVIGGVCKDSVSSNSKGCPM